LGSSLSAPKERVFQNGKSSSLSEIDESLKEQEANSNSKSKMKKITTDISTPKTNKQVVKAVGDSGTNNCNTSKNRKDSNMNCKRKSEVFKTKFATYTEHGDGQSPTKDLQASESINLIVLHYFDFTDPLLFLLIIMIKSLNFRCPNGQEQNREELQK
jgi:hypothetical protein